MIYNQIQEYFNMQWKLILIEIEFLDVIKLMIMRINILMRKINVFFFIKLIKIHLIK